MKRGKNKLIAMMLVLGMLTSMLYHNVYGFNLETNNTNDTMKKVYAEDIFQTRIEAENASMAGDVQASTARSGYSGTGYATGFTQNSSNSWSVQVEIPATKHYTFTIRSASDSYKENYLYINGAQAATIYSKGDGSWNDTTIESLYLEKGTITLSIKESWGWFDLDYINIEEGSGVKDSVYGNATSSLVNPNANQETKDIMAYLKSIYGKQTLSGQSCTLNASTEVEALYKYTGKYPAIRMLDFIFCSPASDYQTSEEVNLALDWDKKGGLNTFQWHWHAPKGGASFYTKNTTFDLSKAVTTKDISRKSLPEIKAMYDSGEISEECYLLVRDIDVISGYLDKLQQSGVTVLWRPLHEASGGWFWWGASGKEPYLWLYKLMFDRQTYYHKLNNLIWVWNGQDASWYPGDEYCDIAGTDIYAEKHNYSAQTDQFMKTVNYSTGNKMATLSENGVMMDPDLLERDNTHWLWFAVWYGDFLIDSSGSIGNSYTEATMVNKVYNSDIIITLDELPDFDNTNTTPTPTATPPANTSTPTPTIAPTTLPSVSPTTAPTTSPTSSPSDNLAMTISNTGNSSLSTNTITNNFTLKYVSGYDLDLSKLIIRYYYTKDGSAAENFYCDTAAVQMNKAPWHVNYVNSVIGTYNKMNTTTNNADTYLDIKINSTDKLTAGATLDVNTRTTKNDWSLYNQNNDFSYGDNSHVAVYYDGNLIIGVEP
jgi:mannan endo-1,4-beta-mannosidase